MCKTKPYWPKIYEKNNKSYDNTLVAYKVSLAKQF